ncbi:MAG: LemA family protein, partial [Betaproteobacteria bacterium]
NTTVRSFPTNLTAMLFKMDLKPNFSVENEAVIAKPPTVDFGKTPAPAPEKKSALPSGRLAAVPAPFALAVPAT